MLRLSLHRVISTLFFIAGYTYTDAQNCCRLIVQHPSTVYLNFQSAYAQPQSQNRGYQQSYQPQQPQRIPGQNYNQAYQNPAAQSSQQRPIVNSGYTFVSPQNGGTNIVYGQDTYANGVENKVFGVAQTGAVNYLNPQAPNSAYAVPGSIPQRDQNQSTAAANSQGQTYYVSSTYAGNQAYPSMVQNPSNVAPIGAQQPVSGGGGAPGSAGGQYVQSSTPGSSPQYDQSSAGAFGAAGVYGVNQQGQQYPYQSTSNPSNQQSSMAGVGGQEQNQAASGGVIYGQGNAPNNQQGFNDGSASTIYPSGAGSTAYPSTGAESTGYPSTATPYQSTPYGSTAGTTPGGTTAGGYGSTMGQDYTGATTAQPGNNNGAVFVAPVGAGAAGGAGAAYGQGGPQSAQSSGTIYGQGNAPPNQSGYPGDEGQYSQGSTAPNGEYPTTANFNDNTGSTPYGTTPGFQSTEPQQYGSTAQGSSPGYEFSTLAPNTQSGISSGAAAGIGAAAGAGAAIGAAGAAGAAATQQGFNDGANVATTGYTGPPYQFSTIHPNTSPYGNTNMNTGSTVGGTTPQQSTPGISTGGTTPQGDAGFYGAYGGNGASQGPQGSTAYPSTYGSTQGQPGTAETSGMYTGSPTPYGNENTGYGSSTPEGFQGSTMAPPGSSQGPNQFTGTSQGPNQFTGSTAGNSPQYDQSSQGTTGQGFTGSPSPDYGNPSTQQNPNGPGSTSPYTSPGFTPNYDDQNPGNAPETAQHRNAATVSSLNLLITALVCIVSMHLSR
uniref:Fibroin heavy chain n=1 Tax=Panagrellus redivivus TaxID=6233 RepID=A0A7E4WA56_PANRE